MQVDFNVTELMTKYCLIMKLDNTYKGCQYKTITKTTLDGDTIEDLSTENIDEEEIYVIKTYAIIL